MLRAAVFAMLTVLPALAFGQVVCENGVCRTVTPGARTTVPATNAPSISLSLIGQEDSQGLTPNTFTLQAFESVGGGEQFERVIRATVRVTVNGVCGSGTVVGKDRNGRALILTNAHVAGTSKGRVVNVERWDTNGISEKSTAVIVASGYGRGMSIDFAILRASDGFAASVTPIPMANRQPDTSKLITTFGCPRCEWPSLQVLKLNRSEGQILTWHPEAIGGRSGSSVIDYTENGPEVVGLLTWGGGGEGLGQSIPFVLNALQGRLPASLEALPPYAKEVAFSEPTVVKTGLGNDSESEDLVDAITGGKLRPNRPNKEPGCEGPSCDAGLLNRNRNPLLLNPIGTVINYAIVFVFGALAGFVFRGPISKWLS